MKRIQLIMLGCALAVSVLLVGCKDDMNPHRTFSVEVSNLTEHQPLAAIAVVLHESGYHAYVLGSIADSDLEMMAEGGDPSVLLASAASEEAVMMTTANTDLTLPGNKSILEVKGLGHEHRLSLVGMLVNTNDGFIGLDAIDLSGLAKGESLILHAKVYDAGTEANNESADSVPAQGGEGFNASRDDRDFVGVHPGVVSMDDGLTGSSLDQSHRFDSPAARVVITRK